MPDHQTVELHRINLRKLLELLRARPTREK